MEDIQRKNTISNLLKQRCLLVVPQLVDKIVEKHLEIQLGETASDSEHKIPVSRRKALMFAESGRLDETGSFTIFGQIVSNLEQEGYDDLRNFKLLGVDHQCFKIQFLGEGGIDAGGLFRDVLVNIAQELMSPEVLPLLARSPNNKNDHGNYRECFILNSTARSPTYLKLLRYLGGLLAFNLLTKSPMPLNMAPFFWKQIAGQDTMTIEDLDGIDSYSSQMLANLRQYSGFLSDEEFDASIDQTFTTVLSNGDEVELCPDGELKRVTKSNVDHFIDLVLKARANESAQQLSALRGGMSQVMRGGVEALALVPWHQLEARACGAKVFDLEKFKSITSFQDCESSHPIIARFWRVFESLSEEEKGLYLKFVWGRSRLPIDCSEAKHVVVLCDNLDSNGFP